jgi:glycerol-1-phosphate dehydrogenase [NAD(P)+]
MLPSPLAVEIRSGAISALGDVLAQARISRTGLVGVVLGQGFGEQIVEAAGPALGSARLLRISSASVEAARDLADSLRREPVDAVVGIGGGRTLDVAKYAASLTGLPFVSVATTLTHDGLASPVASLEHGGIKGSFGVALPFAVIVDLDFVRRSPAAHVVGGIGDVVSNLNAIADWRLAEAERGEAVDGLAAALAAISAESVLHHPGGAADEDFLAVLAEGLVLSGLAMAVAGTSRPCSGSCHEISHAIDALYPGRSTHGLQVAVGALFSSWLRRDPKVTALDECLSRHRVSRLRADLGLSTEEFARAVVVAPSTRPDRFTVLEHLGLTEDDVRERVETFVKEFG